MIPKAGHIKWGLIVTLAALVAIGWIALCVFVGWTLGRGARNNKGIGET